MLKKIYAINLFNTQIRIWIRCSFNFNYRLLFYYLTNYIKGNSFRSEPDPVILEAWIKNTYRIWNLSYIISCYYYRHSYLIFSSIPFLNDSECSNSIDHSLAFIFLFTFQMQRKILKYSRFYLSFFFHFKNPKNLTGIYNK